MSYWKFTSAAGWFSMLLPENWSEYEDDEGTAAFFNTQKWSGNLRITPNKFSDANKVNEFINNEFKEPHAIATKVATWDAVFYSRKAGDDSIIYFWIAGTENYIFICSFSVNMDMIGTELHSQELTVVENALNSIKLS